MTLRISRFSIEYEGALISKSCRAYIDEALIAPKVVYPTEGDLLVEGEPVDVEVELGALLEQAVNLELWVDSVLYGSVESLNSSVEWLPDEQGEFELKVRAELQDGSFSESQVVNVEVVSLEYLIGELDSDSDRYPDVYENYHGGYSCGYSHSCSVGGRLFNHSGSD